MAAGWIRKTFSSDGVTEYPVGPQFQRLRSRFGGVVILALDVSQSMQGSRLSQAVKGCRRFIDEAVEAGYSVGLILWHHGVAANVPPEADPKAARNLLKRAADSSGGTNVLACLDLAHRQLMATEAGDRVLAIFGDGDLGNRQAAETKAAALIRDDIRILTCGLGESSAQELASISTEKAVPRTATSENLADSIASMAQGLIRKG